MPSRFFLSIVYNGIYRELHLLIIHKVGEEGARVAVCFRLFLIRKSHGRFVTQRLNSKTSGLFCVYSNVLLPRFAGARGEHDNLLYGRRTDAPLELVMVTIHS